MELRDSVTRRTRAVSRAQLSSNLGGNVTRSDMRVYSCRYAVIIVFVRGLHIFARDARFMFGRDSARNGRSTRSRTLYRYSLRAPRRGEARELIDNTAASLETIRP